MTFEELAPEYETCTLLKELGFRQDTALAWWRTNLGQGYTDSYLVFENKDKDDWATKKCAAPTFQEIWDVCPEILPHILGSLDPPQNIAQVAAEMWIWLTKNGDLNANEHAA